MGAVGTDGGTRTHTGICPSVCETLASANSATSAPLYDLVTAGDISHMPPYRWLNIALLVLRVVTKTAPVGAKPCRCQSRSIAWPIHRPSTVIPYEQNILVRTDVPQGIALEYEDIGIEAMCQLPGVIVFTSRSVSYNG